VICRGVNERVTVSRSSWGLFSIDRSTQVQLARMLEIMDMNTLPHFRRVRELIAYIQQYNWQQIGQRQGSGPIRVFKHPNKRGLVTIAGYDDDPVSQNAARTVLEQADLA